MRCAGRGAARWGTRLIAVLLMLRAGQSFRAEETPASTAPPPAARSSFGEQGTPDAPARSEGKSSPSAAASVLLRVCRRMSPARRKEPRPAAARWSGRRWKRRRPASPLPPAPNAWAPRRKPAPTRLVDPRAQCTTVPASAQYHCAARGPGYYTFLELLRRDRRQRPPVYPYPRFGIIPYSFFNADWRYLDRADEREHDYFDFLKRIPLGDNFLFTTGGEWRWRYNNEVDSRLSGRDNVYDLTRTRVYGDFWFRDLFRIYGEFINAQSFNQDLPPVPIDQYNPNFLNLFADAKLGTIRDQPLWLRGGRQELLYGSQRLISPLDWGNTRRTFQGGKVFWQNEKLSIDGFVVQPVLPSANRFASVIWQQVFSGIWGTYRPIKGEVIDLYYLNFQDSTQIYAGQNGVRGTQNVSTVGSRWYGNKNDWLWDAEAMLQFGRYSNQGILANAYTMGGGYYFSKWWMNPTVWLYYDHASGDPGPGKTDVHRTFNQLFPFGHYFFGMMDITGRQNINDVHADLSFFPVRWWAVWRSITFYSWIVRSTRCTTRRAYPHAAIPPARRALTLARSLPSSTISPLTCIKMFSCSIPTCTPAIFSIELATAARRTNCI